MKIFPRNLTAHADYIVRGNPVGSRPESGVDNSFPGLEFDQRNLERQFFVGLYFEFQSGSGARLQKKTADMPALQELQESDLATQGQELFLLALKGQLMSSDRAQNPSSVLFQEFSGSETWEHLHALRKGRVVILIAPRRAEVPSNWNELLDNAYQTGASKVERDQNGRLRWAIFVGERATYLDEQGVIDPDVYRAGELTRTLCNPWHYDFRDCGCFYWASNKPDLVASVDGQHPYINFLRRDRRTPPPTDVTEEARRWQLELGYLELINGEWNDTLAVVLNDQEQDYFVARWIGIEEVITELQYLASVEHALSIEYLYAHYSLNAPVTLTGKESEQTQLIHAAALEIYRIAVDEMRHMNWVNEALGILDQPPVVGRATVIGPTFQRPFQLLPLTGEQLQWFINVEAPSKALDLGVDGMYTRLLASIEATPTFPHRERLIPLIKLIIDEGDGHYKRFLDVQRRLRGIPESEYLRPLADPPTRVQGYWQDICDAYYATLLHYLKVTFALREKAGGQLLHQAIGFMRNLHETAHMLATEGVKVRFRLPSWMNLDYPLPPITPAAIHEWHAVIDKQAMEIRQTTEKIKSKMDKKARLILEKQEEVTERSFANMRKAIDENLSDITTF